MNDPVSPPQHAPVTGDERGSSWFWLAFTALSALAITPFWVGEYLPMVDLPQHVAQLAIKQRWADETLHYPDYYRINWYTNQLLAYQLTRLFALAMPLTAAIKCLLSLTVLGLGGTAYWIVRTVRGNPYWSLVVLPAAYGFSLYWGLLNYIVALPIGLVLVVVSVRYALAPSRGRTLAIFATANLLFLAHALILAYAGLVSVMVVAVRARTWRAKALGCAALASVLPTVAAWWIAIRLHEPSTAPTGVAAKWGWYRLGNFFSYQVSTVIGDHKQIALGALLFGLPFFAGARLTRETWRWVPLGVTASLFMTVPIAALDIDMLYGRVAAFALPTLLFALAPNTARKQRPWQSAVLTAVVALQLSAIVLRFKAFADEAGALDQVLAAAEPGKRLLYLPTDTRSRVVPLEAYSHFGCWYQVKIGGVADYSFAELFPTWHRYRPNMEPGLPHEFDSNAEKFRYAEHDGHLFDYFLARGPVLDAWFAGAEVTTRVVAHAAEWTLIAASRPTPRTTTTVTSAVHGR